MCDTSWDQLDEPETPTIHATLFTRPHGNKRDLFVRNVYEDDAAYINKQCINVSMEDIGDDFVIYFDDGTMVEDDATTPDEIIVLAQGRTCEETIAEGVRLCKERSG